MNVKNNRRRKASQEKIEKAFIELLQTREIKEITVSDIIKITGLNRSTFYANYVDVYDINGKQYNAGDKFTPSEDANITIKRIETYYYKMRSFAIVNGERIRQVGNITMDQMMFDLGDSDAQVGDVVTLLDETDLSLDTWAEILGTINYELTCRLKVRLPRIYTR